MCVLVSKQNVLLCPLRFFSGLHKVVICNLPVFFPPFVFNIPRCSFSLTLQEHFFYASDLSCFPVIQICMRIFSCRYNNDPLSLSLSLSVCLCLSPPSELIAGTPSLKINHGSGTLVLQLTNNIGVADRRWHRLDVRSNNKVSDALTCSFSSCMKKMSDLDK